MEGAPKKSLRIEKGIRSMLAGAAFLGTVGGAEVPKEGSMPQMAAAEAREAFDANKETEMFIAEIQSMSTGIDDARGRHTLQTHIEIELTAFALALKTRTPKFSAEGDVHMTGEISFEDTERAKEYLRPKLAIVSSQNNQSIAILKQMVNTKPLSKEDIEATKKAMRELRGGDAPARTEPSRPMPSSPGEALKQGTDQMKQMEDEIKRHMQGQQDMMRDIERQQRDMFGKGFPPLPGQ